MNSDTNRRSALVTGCALLMLNYFSLYAQAAEEVLPARELYADMLFESGNRQRQGLDGISLGISKYQ